MRQLRTIAPLCVVTVVALLASCAQRSQAPVRTERDAVSPPPATAERGRAPGDKREYRMAPAPAAEAAMYRASGAQVADEVADLPPMALAGEELWVIVRDGEGTAGPPSDDTIPGLRAKLPGEPRELPLPLSHTDVVARVAGYIAEVDVRQQYQNPYDTKIEAVYVFPLPQDAAVNEFVMTIGPRRIRGIIREREEAEALYAEARRQGYVASLLTQERPNVFTQSVANIEPGAAIDVELTYVNTLRAIDGDYELVFPMVVGPRFNPPGSRDGIGAVAHGNAGRSGQPVEVPYLRPDRERSGHDISLAVELDAGMAIEAIESPTHAIETTDLGSGRARIELARRDRVPNRDFVLRYRLAGDTVKTAFLTHRDERGGFFTLMLEPPASLASQPRAPMEMVFVLDCSGSMHGAPLDIAKAAAERALRTLTPDDTFQIIQFSMSASQLGPEPIPATPQNVRRGIDHLRGLESEGGTMMIEGIKGALDFPHDPRRLRIVTFMTDGYIGNEAEILGEIQRRLGDARIFSFGIGSATNRYLLERMALLGRGAVAFVGLDRRYSDAIDRFYDRVSHPALTDLAIDWGELEVDDVYPRRLPDLFVGRPVVITGRLHNDPGRARIRIRGLAGGERTELVVTADTRGGGHDAIASIWARARIAELEDEETATPSRAIADEIREVALAYKLMSAYTAFVAVDSAARTAGGPGATVVQPVPVPEGVDFDATVR